MENIILIILLILIVGGGIAYIYKSKKSGNVCIGCPHANKCHSQKHSCSCGDKDTKISKK